MSLFADDPFPPLVTDVLKQLGTRLRRILGPADAVCPAHGFAQKPFALFQRQPGDIIVVEIQEIEQVEVGGIVPHARLDHRGVLEMEPPLQEPEARPPVRIQADHLSIEDDAVR